MRKSAGPNNVSPPRKRRVCFVVNSLAGGGAERIMLEIVNASRVFADRYDMALVLIDHEPHAYTPPDWLPVHRLDGRFSLARSISQFMRFARTEKPDVTLSFLTRANIVTVIAAKLLGHRAVISERVSTSGHFGDGLGGQISKAIVRLFYPRATRVIAVSQEIAGELHGDFSVPRAKLSAIANPVNADRIRAAAAEPFVPPVTGPYAVAVSRLSKNKNVVLLVEALAASRLELPLVVLGEGPERAAILARAAELGVAERLHMPGFSANPYPIIANAAFYVSGSNAEGFPNGLVEALALGVPVVATNCPSGPAEILDDRLRETVAGLHAGRWGILTPPNDVAALARGMAMALDADTATRYRAAGPERAAAFTVDAARERYWEVIRQAMIAPKSSSSRT